MNACFRGKIFQIFTPILLTYALIYDIILISIIKTRRKKLCPDPVVDQEAEAVDGDGYDSGEDFLAAWAAITGGENDA